MPNKDKILFVVQLPPPVHGASMMNRYVVENPFLKDNYDIKILPLKFVDRNNQIGKMSLKKIFLMFSFCLRLTKTLLFYKPDLVYYTLAPFGKAFLRDFLFISIIKCFKNNIMLHLHGKGIQKFINKNPCTFSLYKKVFNKTNVIHLSQSLLYDIKPFQDIIKNIYIIPNGIPEINENGMAKEKKIGRNIRIIYLSNLKKSKGVLVLIEALKVLKGNQTNFEVNIVGNPDDVSIGNLEEIVRASDLENNVRILGPKYGKDKYQELLNADIFVFPTYYENECFPLSILEAMQMNNAIVSTDNGAIKEIITDGENGFIVEQEDPNALAQSIRMLIDNTELLEEIKHNNKIKFKDKYTLKIFYKAINKAILESIKIKK